MSVLEGKPASDYWNHVKLNKPVEKAEKAEVARGA